MRPSLRSLFLSLSCALVLVAGASHAAQLDVDQNDGGCNDVTGTPYCSIDAAAADSVDGDTISVAPGTYVENVIIDANVALVSTGGRAVTTIDGISSIGALGTVQIINTTVGVTIGGVGTGFTILGIDNGAPGIENAAVYVRGNHTDLSILDNEIVARGDGGFTAEFGATMSGTLVDGNEFSGKTYMGAEPGDCGFGNQFSAANVPRQLFVIGGGGGGGNTSDTTFINNLVSGTAGDVSTQAGCTVFGQGNNLATVDSDGGTISGNSFTGQTARFATSLRARGPNTAISGNQFFSDKLIGLACYSDTQEVGDDLGTIAGMNAYDAAAVLFVTLPTDTSGKICSACGNEQIDEGEDCDGELDEACPGLCGAQSCQCPLLVTLESFTAEVTGHQVVLRWSTAMEVDNIGFRLLRERVGQAEKSRELITPELIPAQGDGLNGSGYEFVDASPGKGGTVLYYLEDVDRWGRATTHGPIEVTLPELRLERKAPSRVRK